MINAKNSQIKIKMVIGIYEWSPMMPTNGDRILPTRFIPTPKTADALPACWPCFCIANENAVVLTSPTIETMRNKLINTKGSELLMNSDIVNNKLPSNAR